MNQTDTTQYKRGFRVYVYKADRRYKSGERLFNKYEFSSYTEEAISDEVAYLRSQLYKREDGWRLEYKPSTVQVRNLMSGSLVEIDFEQRAGPCDPSMERYWSM